MTVLLKESASTTESVEKSLTIFAEAVELSSDLEIIGTALPNGEEVFVIRDYSKTEGIEGAYVEVSIDEIVQKVTDTDKAQEFINVIQNVRKPIVLEGITRIVGYYSRMSNWNKSKVGELRDRHSKNYALGGQSPVFEEDRDTYVNNL
ncbi:MAG: hypothetical protein MAG551_02328 [Candidatus Scalindua arabica]|uniref:Uncharacterized protein n=1 Tax=Candidatus Scalindua arabica TaxID=1127984 RepID=A0A942A5A7_9BACT|nr:hypothetical protein [Candidatus Scalindua arabica]